MNTTANVPSTLPGEVLFVVVLSSKFKDKLPIIRGHRHRCWHHIVFCTHSWYIGFSIESTPLELLRREKEVTEVIDGKVTEKKLWKPEYFELRVSDYKYLSFTELKEAISEVYRVLLIWVSRRTTCSTRTLRPGTTFLHCLRSFRAQFCRHIYERRAPSNSSQICHLRWWSESNYSWQYTFTSRHSNLQNLQTFNVCNTQPYRIRWPF